MTVLDPVIAYLMQVYGKRSHRVVSLGQVMAGSERPRRPVLRVLDKLTREGYLVQVSDSKINPGHGECGPPRRNPVWRIVRDPSDRPAPKPRSNTNRDMLWRLIRAKRRFTKRDLVVASGVNPATVDEYVRLLERHGHIRRTGKDGRRATYLLVNRQVQRPLGMEGSK